MNSPNEKFKVKLSQPDYRMDQVPFERSEEEREAASGSGFEMTEMDLLYQEALNAMEEVESELNRTSEILLEDVDPDQESEEEGSQEGDLDSPEEKSDTISISSSLKHGKQVTPEMIVEALLFVGGQPLTTKKLCQIIGVNADPDSMEKVIDSLNQVYESQNRPYEIQFGEGGYRLALRNEFSRVQNKVFGLGPREIKLSQEALEILALIAYEQPVTKSQIDKLTKRSTNSILRQLLRRELIELERNDEEDKTNVSYKTTGRFLQLFGLTDLTELPKSEKIEYK